MFCSYLYFFSAYINVGGGLPFGSSLLVILGFLLAFFSTIFFFFKKFFRKLRQRLLGSKKKTVLTVFFLLIIILIGWRLVMNRNESENRKVVILGLDGLEPAIVKQLMAEGKLPNFSRLKERGEFKELASIMPPQSIVIWTSFATGANPGRHGIFDFITRDPQNYLPRLAFTREEDEKLKAERKGKSFWHILSGQGINSVVLLAPNTFPPDKIKGRMLSGMGVPDIRGTEGTFSFYTTEPLPAKEDVGGKVFHVEPRDGVILAELPGPVDTTGGKTKEYRIPFRVEINRDKKTAVIKIDDNTITLAPGSWSSWVHLRFKLRFMKTINGICRFYLREIEPDFKLYCSPINFDPQNPAFPISYPPGYAKQLAREIGLFYTQGMPIDTWALNEARLEESAFLDIVDSVVASTERMFLWELKRFEKGLLFCYFGMTDSIQHMFWRFIDAQSPTYDARLALNYKDVIYNYYQRLDDVLGKVMARIDDQTILIVCSDHGFGPFYRVVHLNSWLKKEGYLVLKDESKEGKEFLKNVDLTKTRAYSYGFGGIYINQKGREGQGIVSLGDETERLKKEIGEKLLTWRDPKNNEPVVKKVYAREKIFNGPYTELAPDIFVGFARGYRASWQTALGAAPQELLEDNLKRWSGDHLFDVSLVPGIILANKEINKAKPSILDIAPTVLKIFGIDIPEDMDGESLL
jgi:predicted AlkP superfamily phosphohydrolase/phosphomutase